MIRVTTKDLESGEEESREIENDWVLTTAGRYYLDGVTSHANGTVILVIKQDTQG